MLVKQKQAIDIGKIETALGCIIFLSYARLFRFKSLLQNNSLSKSVIGRDLFQLFLYISVNLISLQRLREPFTWIKHSFTEAFFDRLREKNRCRCNKI